MMGLSCVQVKAAEKYRDSTNASNDVNARARYTNGKACTLDVRLCSAACSLHCLRCLIHPAVLLLYISRRHDYCDSSSSQGRKALQVTSLNGLMKLDRLMQPMTIRESLFLHSACMASVRLSFTVGRCSLHDCTLTAVF